MLKLHHEQTLKYYIDKCNINDIFNVNFIKNMELHCFNKNEFITCKNSTPDYLYFLVDGTIVKFEDSYSLQNNSSDIYNEFHIIGALEIFTHSNFDYNLKALDDCICIGIPIYIIKNIAFKDAHFLKYFCEFFSSKIYNNNFKSNFFNKEKDAI